MIVTAIKTKPVVIGDQLFPILDQYLPEIHEQDIVVITSKIVSICEGRVVKNDGKTDKYELIRQNCDQYLQTPEMDKYHIMITINQNIMVASGGIDESNGNGYFILWPKNPERSADKIWQYLRTKNKLKHLGVIITDSRITPLRWGTIGISLSWSGFKPLKSYIGKPDIFGRPLRFTYASVIDGLAASAVLTMGEGREQTPLAIIRDVHRIQFQNQPPTSSERQALKIALEDDIYAPMLTAVKWKSRKNL